MNEKKLNKKPFLIFALIAAFISSLCCFTPIIFVLFGLAAASTAAYWGNYFFFGFWWLFIAIGILLIAVMLIIYWRKNQVCTLDAVKRNKRKIINSVLLSFTLFIVIYIGVEILWELVWIKFGMTSWEELRSRLS
ncbi:MAG: hypothetical protein COY58_00920 [Gammaproteobacteria bacterium CG_4_10_14_0_8_um_filter_38_16]|nr:MAG: hypothetical protein COY58_00920 [Gammaproteobacteria bacterium CG_4_10_14_0_8_um_filter_38_16]PJA03402.1 MAG: hypothetical protein COX72_05310 [Gammaproteobacteria bacterium CG_4_10_14_0_2_um_filter_38_22]PJB09897.1 MAG: hypothetical protein CO120_07740 [Gammaproteobacteria bacterium CG_4_9_14_3_um_filter_38_9]